MFWTRPWLNTCIVFKIMLNVSPPGTEAVFTPAQLTRTATGQSAKDNHARGSTPPHTHTHKKKLWDKSWIVRSAAWRGHTVRFWRPTLSETLCVNSPFPSEPGSSELMCCGLACLRLDMVQPSGAKSCKQFSCPSSSKFFGLGKLAPQVEMRMST